MKISADIPSNLHQLVTQAQFAEGKNMVELVVNDEGDADKALFLNHNYSWVFNEDIQDSLWCYHNN